MQEEVGLGVELAGHQGVADEDRPGLVGRDRAVVHAAVGIDDEAVERGLLVGGDPLGVLLPARIAVTAAQEVFGEALDPAAVDGRDGAREQPRGLADLGRHEPLRVLLRHARAREDVDLAVAGGLVLAVALVARDVAQQAGQDGAMHVVVGRRFRVGLQAHVLDLGAQLAVQVDPFTHADERQEVLRRHLAQAVLREFRAPVGPEPPEIQ